MLHPPSSGRLPLLFLFPDHPLPAAGLPHPPTLLCGGLSYYWFYYCNTIIHVLLRYKSACLLSAQQSPWQTEFRLLNMKEWLVMNMYSFHCKNWCKVIKFVDEQLMTRGSMCGHFPHDGLARGRIRDRITANKKNKHNISVLRTNNKPEKRQN